MDTNGAVLHLKTILMKRPTSLTILIFFVIWSLLDSVGSIIPPNSAIRLFAADNLTFLYYPFLFIIIIGGGAFVHALRKGAAWGYPLGLTWLVTGMVYTLYTGYASLSNKPLMTEILKNKREMQGRPVDGIAEFISSPAYDGTLIATAAVLMCILAFFAWKLMQHRSYFSHTGTE